MRKYNIIITLEKYDYQNINLTHKEISKYFLQNLNKIKSLPIKTVAKNSNCSQSSVSSFVKKLGFNNYKELLYEIDESFNLFSFNSKNNIFISDELKIENYYKKTIGNINYAFKKNKNNLLKVVDKIKKSKKIFIFGKGSNIEIIIIFYNYLIKNNYNAFSSYDLDVQKKWIDILSEDDLCIFFSFSGETEEILNIFLEVKKTKAKTVSLSSNIKSQLMQDANEHLVIYQNEDIFEQHTSARISYIFLIMQIMNLLKN
ncbi:MurR/RpiR family transcriptional regulator [Mesomycoplasma neurolyticum]|uniref:GntR family transcriptional regulator n=1 Tax=Mesomycoplasma neurolyticum TaxID=2120 RepID=A0A449A5Q9_9BACT|nr:MurR/RpiR family transcriptional regulator [Mesomycoplasma neurolyticum]VEU59493.1 GntR family transcriptional regulator [Mesomycoplasma neurolyticum]